MTKPREKYNQQRTEVQNRALHLWFSLLAEELNAAGLDMKKVLKPSIDISWSKQSVKEYLWRSIQYAMLGKKSTKNLNSDEIDKVYEELNRFLAEKHQIHVPFPCLEQIEYEEYANKNKNKSTR